MVAPDLSVEGPAQVGNRCPHMKGAYPVRIFNNLQVKSDGKLGCQAYIRRLGLWESGQFIERLINAPAEGGSTESLQSTLSFLHVAVARFDKNCNIHQIGARSVAPVPGRGLKVAIFQLYQVIVSHTNRSPLVVTQFRADVYDLPGKADWLRPSSGQQCVLPR